MQNQIKFIAAVLTAALWLPGCPQAVPSSGQFGTDAATIGGDGSVSGGQDIVTLGDSAVGADTVAPGTDAAIEPDSVAQPDTAAIDQTGSADTCLCANAQDCAGITVGTCQVAECQKCQCAVAVAPNGSDCGGGKVCAAGACTPKAGPGPWAVGIAGGGNHTCALRGDGTLSCWGSNGDGQLGNGTTSGPLYYAKTPQDVALLTKVTAVELGDNHSCAIWGGGKLSCWGDRFSGKTGNGDNSGAATTPEATGAIADAVGLACGTQNGFAVRAGFTLWGWGGNNANVFQTGDFTSKTSPVAVQGVLGAGSVCAGDQHVCLLGASDGLVRCWGRSGDGEVGNGKIGDSNQVYPPTDVGLTGVVALGCGDYHTCAVGSGGKLWCWGKNLSAQLGLGSTSAGAAVPVSVKNISDVKAVAAGQSHTCAVTNAGAVWCWGGNDDGQAGQPASVADVGTPSPVSIGGKAVAIACGRNHSCAVRDDGAVLCWGRNSSGQLGNNSTLSGETPVVVQGSAP